MTQTGCYPAGAAADPRAPWNRADPPLRAFDVDAEVTLVRTARVVTACYADAPDPADALLVSADEAYRADYLPLDDVISFARAMAHRALADPQTRKADPTGRRRAYLRAIERSAEGWRTDEARYAQA